MKGRPADIVLAATLHCATLGLPAILVTIAAVKGSTPRVPGTRMLVTTEGITGSVGGGQLEFEIIAHAQGLMARSATVTTREHFILGPDLRQCCGGALDIVLEPVTAAAANWLSQVIVWDANGQSWQSQLVLGQPSHHRQMRVADEDGFEPGVARLRKSGEDIVLVENSGQRWPLLYLFGAGHVGRALVNLLGDLPCHVIWSDGRPDIFPALVPGNVAVDASEVTVEMTAEMIKAAPMDAHFLVMTHSHALDFEIVQAVLQNGRFASLGLIGSNTKRARFVQRLKEAGIPERDCDRLQCPIGLNGIKSKVPAVIAIAVVAEFLLRLEAAVSGREESVAGVQLSA